MINEQDYKRMLADAKRLIANGRLEEARVLLQEIEARGLGHADASTALGIPRRLHSARLKLAKAAADPIDRIGYQYHLVPPPARLAAHAIFSPVERASMVELSRTPVPRCIHQIWLGSKPVPPTVAAWERHAISNGYEYRLWREADLVESRYDQSPALGHMLAAGDYPGAVDVVRYMILRDLGGIYLDCDWYPARRTASFHDALPLTGLSAFAEETPRNTGMGSTLLANSFIATPPGNPVLARLCDVLPSVVADLGDAPAWWSTGPLIFTIVARAGPISLAGADFVAASLPSQTSVEDVEAFAAGAEHDQAHGMLIAWKPW